MGMLNQAKAFFEDKLAALTAKNIRGKNKEPYHWIETKSDIDLFLFGMENPLFDLDSIAFITME